MDNYGKSIDTEVPQSVENEISTLTQLDKQIEDLLNLRAEYVNRIEKQNEVNRDRLNIRQRWYDSYVRGHDVPMTTDEAVVPMRSW